MKTFRKILLLWEEGAAQHLAIAQASAIAAWHRATLTILDVIPEGTADAASDIFAFHSKALDPLLEPHRGQVPIDVQLAVGTDFVEVINTVLRGGHDLVMKVAEAPDYLERLFGSTDMHLLRKCPCPLWLLKPGEDVSSDAVLAAVDFDPDHIADGPNDDLNRRILAVASSLALARGAALHLVHAWGAFAESRISSRAENPAPHLDLYVKKEYTGHQQRMSRLAESLRMSLDEEARDRLRIGYHLPKGPAVKAVPQLARSLPAGIVVMGTVARTGIPGLIIGNTAEAILYQLQCSVLAVKPGDFVSPVQPAPRPLPQERQSIP
jgi:nucleotide-binding universal stress UspA family protein